MPLLSLSSDKCKQKGITLDKCNSNKHILNEVTIPFTPIMNLTQFSEVAHMVSACSFINASLAMTVKYQ